MSRTFEALQRAAQEKKARQRAKSEIASDELIPPPPTVTAPPEADLGEESGSGITQEPTPATTEPLSPLCRPQGEPDSSLSELLREHLGDGDGIQVESDGWVRGEIDRETAGTLLKCYALLHCLRHDHENWFWFWGSSTMAKERARRCGLPLDLDGLD